MTGLPTWAELTGLLALIGTGIGAIWNRERNMTELRGSIESLKKDAERLKEESSKALRSHEAAMEMKNEELRLVRENAQRREDRLEETINIKDRRIQELEDRLYMGGPK